MADVKQYSFAGKCYLFFCWCRTRLFFPGVKIIRFPFDIRNRKFVSIGNGVSFGRMCRIEVASEGATGNEKRIVIGDNFRINDFVHIAAYQSVIIGNEGGIGARSFITDINHGDFSEGKEFDINMPHRLRPLSAKPVRIGNNVWIGENCCICPGVTIGDNSIIGAFSNVVKSIPPCSMAVGNPARVIKRFDFNSKSWRRVDSLGNFIDL